MYDSYNRDIHYLRISVTDKCNLRCRYCMPEEGVPAKRHEDLLSFEEITRIVSEAVQLGFRKIRLTGGEPLVRRGIVDLIGMLRNIEGIDFLGMTTNGTLLEEFAAPLKKAGLDGLNISLDTLDPHKYRYITRGGDIEAVFRGIHAALGNGFSGTKINMVVSDETGKDELEAMQAFCRTKGLILQRIRQYSLLTTKQDEIQYERPPRCGSCNRLRLTADGILKPCLHSEHEIRVDPADIAGSIREAVAAKPPVGLECSNRPMMQIGG